MVLAPRLDGCHPPPAAHAAHDDSAGRELPSHSTIVPFRETPKI
jgi:hypothetical protein